MDQEYLEKKRDMLNKMKEEINDLEYTINNSRKINFKLKTIRDFKISLHLSRLMAPYLLVAGITFGVFSSLMGLTPFVRDDNKKYLEIKKSFDSKGNIRNEMQYDKFDNAKGKITYYGPWNETTDGYSREIKEYAIGKTSEIQLMSIIESNNAENLSHLFGKPSVRNEFRNSLPADETVGESYLEATLYSEDNNDYIVVKESVMDNIGTSLFWLIMTAFLEGVLNATGLSDARKKFEEYVADIKEEYRLVDTNELTRKFEIRRCNYERLTR